MKIRTKSSIFRHIPVIHGARDPFRNTDHRILDFSSNINPAGAPLSIKRALKKNIDAIQTYPDFSSSAVISNLTKYTQLKSENLLVGNGAVEIIYNFCFAFLSKKTKILLPIPVFQEYEAAAKLNDCKISYFKTMSLSENLDSFITQIPKHGCVFLCNPNNPTGELLLKDQILSIIKTAKKLSSYVFVDECFIELVSKSNESVISHVNKYDNLLVLRSLTKSFALPGIRIGYAAASKPIVEVLQKIKIPWSVNSLAQNAASIALENTSHLAKSNLIIKKESDYLKSQLCRLDGVDCHDSSTNFILIKTKHDSTKLQQRLLEENILIRDCKNFRGLDNHYIRIAVKSHKDNLKLVQALVKII